MRVCRLCTAYMRGLLRIPMHLSVLKYLTLGTKISNFGGVLRYLTGNRHHEAPLTDIAEALACGSSCLY
jgi:hypothetical protein